MAIEKATTFSGQTSLIRWSSAVIPKKGEEECGDTFIVKEYGSRVLIAAVDGLGHGSNAASVSRKVTEILEKFTDESAVVLIERCHKKLRGTRGVAMSLAIFDQVEGVMSWIGVGNVDGVLFRTAANKSHKNLVLRGGVVGYKLPPIQASNLSISEGDTLVFATDGVDLSYTDRINTDQTPQEMVRYATDRYVNGSDDALVLTARYVGFRS